MKSGAPVSPLMMSSRYIRKSFVAVGHVMSVSKKLVHGSHFFRIEFHFEKMRTPPGRRTDGAFSFILSRNDAIKRIQ
jgi:hypothetical protein